MGSSPPRPDSNETLAFGAGRARSPSPLLLLLTLTGLSFTIRCIKQGRGLGSAGRICCCCSVVVVIIIGGPLALFD